MILIGQVFDSRDPLDSSLSLSSFEKYSELSSSSASYSPSSPPSSSLFSLILLWNLSDYLRAAMFPVPTLFTTLDSNTAPSLTPCWMSSYSICSASWEGVRLNSGGSLLTSR